MGRTWAPTQHVLGCVSLLIHQIQSDEDMIRKAPIQVSIGMITPWNKQFNEALNGLIKEVSIFLFSLT